MEAAATEVVMIKDTTRAMIKAMIKEWTREWMVADSMVVGALMAAEVVSRISKWSYESAQIYSSDSQMT